MVPRSMRRTWLSFVATARISKDSPRPAASVPKNASTRQRRSWLTCGMFCTQNVSVARGWTRTNTFASALDTLQAVSQTRNAPSADRIVCRGRAGERVAPPRASVSDSRQPTEREIEAAAVGGPATSQGEVWIRTASSRSSRRTWPAHCPFCQFGLACLVPAGRRADAARLGRPREGPLGPTSAGPSAAAAACWGARYQAKPTAPGGSYSWDASPPTGCAAPALRRQVADSPDRKLRGRSHAWWRRAAEGRCKKQADPPRVACAW